MVNKEDVTMKDNKTKCDDCILLTTTEYGRKTCSGLNYAAYLETKNGEYDCPFYKKQRRTNEG